MLGVVRMFSNVEYVKRCGHEHVRVPSSLCMPSNIGHGDELLRCTLYGMIDISIPFLVALPLRYCWD